jgi:hypothetical protein
VEAIERCAAPLTRSTANSASRDTVARSALRAHRDIRRVRDPRTGAVPLLAAYDYEERIWNPPAPLLFQWDRAEEPSSMNGEFIRRTLGEVLAFIGLTRLHRPASGLRRGAGRDGG